MVAVNNSIPTRRPVLAWWAVLALLCACRAELPADPATEDGAATADGSADAAAAGDAGSDAATVEAGGDAAATDVAAADLGAETAGSDVAVADVEAELPDVDTSAPDQVADSAGTDAATPDLADAPGTDAVDAGPVDTGPADNGPADTGPVDTGPADTGPVDTGPVDTGPADNGPADTGPVDTGPADTGPVDTGPVDTGPPDAGPVDTGPVDTGPADTGPADTGPADTGPVDTSPADTGPADTGPADTGPVDTGPADTGPIDTGPADTGPADSGPAPCQVAACTDNNPCTVDSCDALTNKCAYEPTPCPKPACSTDKDCTGGVCDPATFACVGCLTDKNCGGATPVCVGQKCVAGVACTSDTQCKASKQACDKAAGHCVNCLTDAECASGQMCSKNLCIAKTPCKSVIDCPAVCATSLGYCVGCNDSGDCDKSQFCDGNHSCQPKVCLEGACLAGGWAACKADGTGYLAAKSCADGNACTKDSCDNKLGCSNPAQADGFACDDGKDCAGDTCKGGACTTVPLALETTFGFESSQSVTSAAGSEGGGVVGAGAYTAVVAGNAESRAWLFKLDDSGKLVWNFKDPAATSQLSGVASDGLGGAVAVGQQHVAGKGWQMHVRRVDAAGKLVFGAQVENTQLSKAVAVRPGKDLLVVGSTAETLPGLWRYSFDGQSLGTVQLPPVEGLSPQYGALSAIATAANGTVLVGGWRNVKLASGGDGSRTWVGRLSGDALTLDKQWNYSDSTSEVRNIAAMADGTVLVAFYAAGAVSVQALTADLAPLWFKSYGGLNPAARLTTGSATAVGLTGPVNTNKTATLGSNDGALWLLDVATGGVNAQYQYGSPGYEYFVQGIVRPDGFALVGVRTIAAGKDMGWYVKADPWGNSSCGCLTEKANKSCNDGNPCTLDVCDGAKGCVHTAVADNAPCDDGSPYTSSGTCKAGLCAACGLAMSTSGQVGAGSFQTAVAADGTLRSVAWSGTHSTLYASGKDGKLLWTLPTNAFVKAGTSASVGGPVVRADGAFAVRGVNVDGKGGYFGFLADGKPMVPAFTYDKAGLAYYNCNSWATWGKDGSWIEIADCNQNQGLMEIHRQWGQPNDAATTVQTEFAYTPYAVQGDEFWRGNGDGDAQLCVFGTQADKKYVRFGRRNGSTGKWSKEVQVPVSDGPTTCPPFTGYDGIIVVSTNSADSSVSASVYDSKGSLGWTITGPWIKGVVGFASIAGELYAYGYGEPYTSQGAWTVWHLDAAGKVTATTVLGKVEPYAITNSLQAARVVGTNLVLGGSTSYKTAASLDNARSLRAEFQTASATFTCQAPPACQAAAETCNGLDDNCDGKIDEGCNAVGCGADGASCGLGKGACSKGHCLMTDAKGHKWTLVPGGTFYMGCNSTLDAECESKEKPQHEVNLSSYWIGVYEITAASYKACVDANGAGCTPPVNSSAESTYGISGKEQHPINHLKWAQAQAYCNWMGGALPSEAQWEKAARGGCDLYQGMDCAKSEPKYPWGNAKPECGLHSCAAATAAVGTGSAQGPSPYGAYDMAGNVAEWVLDYHDPDFYSNPLATQADPVNTNGQYPVYRGGSFSALGAYLRAGLRVYQDPNVGSSAIGARCVRAP